MSKPPAVPTAARCSCGRQVDGAWFDGWCPACGRHNDALFIADSSDPQLRSRDQIIAEYRAGGMDSHADRLAAEVIPSPLPGPLPGQATPATEPTSEPIAFVQRSLLDQLDAA